MNVRNFYTEVPKDNKNCHGGEGILKQVSLFKDSDFNKNIRFINYSVLPSGTSIGEHTHGDDEELYIILEGSGLMTCDGESKQVSAGAIIVNKPFGTHGLVNNTEKDMKILVLEVY